MALLNGLRFIVVLSDGETYADLSDCKIVCLTDQQMEQVEIGRKVKRLESENQTVSSAILADYLFQDPHFDDFIEECNTIAEQMDWVK